MISTRPAEGEARIAAIGCHIPATRVSNVGPAARLGVDAEALRTKIGIVELARKRDEQRASDLCMEAFADLRARASLDPGRVQLVCVVTQNPDFKVPHTAAIVHQKLGLPKGCMTFDLSQGCAGYTHGVAVVCALMERLGLEHALLFTSDPYSTIVDPEDKATALLFGDAATATHLTREGAGYALVDVDHGTMPRSYGCLVCEDKLQMDGRAVLMTAAREVPPSILALLARHGLTTAEVDEFLLHPGSKHMIELLRKALTVEAARAPFECAEYGNTVSSSIPLMLQRRLRANGPRRVVLSGFGVGFSWANCLIESRF